MTYLSSNQLKQYEDQGYISPIEVLSSSEALEARKETRSAQIWAFVAQK